MNKKKRILQLGKFCPFSSTGGVEYVTKLIHNSPYVNYSIHTLYLNHNNTIKYRKLGAKVNFSINTFAFSLSYIYIFFRLKKYYSIYIGHLPNPLCIILIFSKKFHLFWHSDLLNKNYIYTFLYRLIEIILLKNKYKIFYTSKIYYLNSWTFPQKNVHIIPLAVIDHNLVRHQINDKINVLSVGRLVNYKNFDTLIHFAKNYPNFNLTIVGNGPLFYQLKYFTESNSLKNVQILNNVNESELNNIYSKTDVFTLASNSRSEAFGIVLIESLSYGIPLLIANNPGSGMMEILQQGVNGEKFDINIEKDFIEKLKKICDNINYYRLNAKNTFINNYNLDVFYKNFFAALNDETNVSANASVVNL